MYSDQPSTLIYYIKKFRFLPILVIHKSCSKGFLQNVSMDHEVLKERTYKYKIFQKT